MRTPTSWNLKRSTLKQKKTRKFVDTHVNGPNSSYFCRADDLIRAPVSGDSLLKSHSLVPILILNSFQNLLHAHKEDVEQCPSGKDSDQSGGKGVDEPGSERQVVAFGKFTSSK